MPTPSHAEPWAWHPEDGERVNGGECHSGHDFSLFHPIPSALFPLPSPLHYSVLGECSTSVRQPGNHLSRGCDMRFRLAGVVGFLSLAVFLAAAARGAEGEGKKRAFEWHKDVIYADSDGVALCMDIFTPTGPKNGVGIIDIASGAWHSDRAKIRDHMMAQVYDIFCAKGYTVFAVRPGS